MYSVGEVVDWTVNCGVSLYLEFKPLEAGVLWDRNGIRRVPCNKSEIFADTALSHVEKRMLMKFIEYCSKLIEEANYEPDYKFKDTLSDKKIPEHLQNILLYAILLIDNEDITLGQALSRMEKYVSSLGIYKDNCALLYPMYGSSDIPQGFCRMSAVYEGTYVITEDLQVLALEKNEEISKVISSFGELQARQIYVNPIYSHLDPALSIVEGTATQRGVVLCRGVIKPSDSPVLFSVPPHEFGNEKVMYVLQLSESTSTVPEGYCMLHAWGDHCTAEILTALLSTVPVEILFLSTYTQHVVHCTGAFKHVQNPGGIEILEHFVRNM